RHALPNLARGIAVFEEQLVRVGMNVDEPRRDNEALGVDFAFRRTDDGTADFADPVSAARHVADVPRVARPIDDFAATENDIERRVGRTDARRAEKDYGERNKAV